MLHLFDVGSERVGDMLRNSFSEDNINDVLEQLKRTPVGLDVMLGRVVPYGIAFHHAGEANSDVIYGMQGITVYNLNTV